MNFYILINSRKVRSKEKIKDNFLRIPFKYVGTKGEKKYKSKIIFDDIKIDFSINLIQKALNYNRNYNKTPDMRMLIRPKTGIPKKDIKKANIGNIGKPLDKKKMPERKKLLMNQSQNFQQLGKQLKLSLWQNRLEVFQVQLEERKLKLLISLRIK